MQPYGDNFVLAVPVVPVFYIHSFEQPFCIDPLRQCQLHKPAVLFLFTRIIERKLELEKAANLSERTV
jgi:hypothetical protein